MIDLALLKTEIDKAEYAAMSDEEVFAALLQEDRNEQTLVPVADMQRYLFENSKYLELMDKRTDQLAPEQERQLARKIIARFEVKAEAINIAAPPFQQGLATMVSAGFLTQPQSDDIAAMGVRAIPRWKKAGLSRYPLIRHIQKARAI